MAPHRPIMPTEQMGGHWQWAHCTGRPGGLIALVAGLAHSLLERIASFGAKFGRGRVLQARLQRQRRGDCDGASALGDRGEALESDAARMTAV